MGCTQSQKIYGSRHEWFLHEAQHRRQWSCSYCKRSFSSEPGFSDHIKQDHPTACAPHQLQALIDMCVRPVDSHLLEQCPLCLQEGQQLRSHLARHLRTLALFVLPKTSNGDREDVNSDAVQSGGSEEHEDANANIEARSNSDQMSDISEDALIDVPKIDSQAGQLAEIDAVEERLSLEALERRERRESFERLERLEGLERLKRLKRLEKLERLESAAETLHRPALPAFLMVGKAGTHLENTTESLTSSTDEILLQKLNKSSGHY